MKPLSMFCTILLFFVTFGMAQQKTAPPPEQQSRVQDIVRVVPELLPQAIRDSINNHPVDKEAEMTSAEQMSQDGHLRYRINFLKDEKTWSKTYDAEGRHIDEGRKEEFLKPFSFY